MSLSHIPFGILREVGILSMSGCEMERRAGNLKPRQEREISVASWTPRNILDTQKRNLAVNVSNSRVLFKFLNSAFLHSNLHAYSGTELEFKMHFQFTS